MGVTDDKPRKELASRVNAHGMPANLRTGPTIDEMRSDLLAAGWKKYHDHDTVWEAPTGELYRGPAHAFHVMEYFRNRWITG